ncbi:MauE/DoxX family redox-associated membrane protein [Verrucomicrobiales bacterium BCK34]|nr:MauE/DoxX family redox-associated membrane protein [Verrucomicrobiales bacterium BCK34]
MKTLVFVLRLVFGALFIWSGIAKIKDPIGFADAVRNFEIIGDPYAVAVALYLPWLEVISGIAVMWDRFAKSASFLITGMIAVFTLLIVTAWVRGLDISCGCFGGTGEMNYPVKIAQNIGLIAMGLFIWWKSAAPAEHE